MTATPFEIEFYKRLGVAEYLLTEGQKIADETRVMAAELADRMSS